MTKGKGGREKEFFEGGRIMTGCFLRVLGDAFDPESFLQTAKLSSFSVFRKGYLSGRQPRPHQTSGFSCEVSSSDTNLQTQINEAIKFIRRYRDDLIRLRNDATVESCYLDFANDCRLNELTVCVQRDFLPSELLFAAGECGLGICLTQFPTLSDYPVREEPAPAALI